MTLILGFNLSDRVYLASDIRVKKEKAGYKNPIFEDCVQKINFLNKHLAVAVAGDVELAQFLVKNLKNAPFFHKGIECIRERIEYWAKAQVTRFLSNNLRKSPKVCLLFGGVDISKNNIINKEKFLNLTKEFKDKEEIVRFTKKSIIYEAMQKAKISSKDIFLSTPKTKIFALRIDTNPNNSFIDIQDSEWGDCLAYGPAGFKKDMISEDAFRKIELNDKSGDRDNDNLHLTAFINQVAEDNNFQEIGGSILPIMIDSLGISIKPTATHVWDTETSMKKISDLRVIDGKLFHVENNGKQVPLINFVDYDINSENELGLEF